MVWVFFVTFNFKAGIKMWILQAYLRKSLVADLLKLVLFFFFFFESPRMNYGGFKIFMYSLMMKGFFVVCFVLFFPQTAGPNY